MFNQYQQGSAPQQGGFHKKPGFKKSFQKVGKKFNKWGGADRQAGGYKAPFHKQRTPGQENAGQPQQGFAQHAQY